MAASQHPIPAPATPPPGGSEASPRFADGTVPEASAKPRGLLMFCALAFVVIGVVLLRALSGGTPFLIVGGTYFPSWFAAGVVGAVLAMITVVALRSHPVSRACGTGLIFFNCTVIYAFLAWRFIFS